MPTASVQQAHRQVSARLELRSTRPSYPFARSVIDSQRVDALLIDDIASARRSSPEEKLRQALELMAAGFRLERTALRLRHVGASEAELEKLFEAWLIADQR